MVTAAELLANKQAAIAAKVAKTGETLAEYSARTGINPYAVVSNGQVIYGEETGPAVVQPAAQPIGTGTGAGVGVVGPVNTGGTDMTTALTSLIPAGATAVIGPIIGALTSVVPELGTALAVGGAAYGVAQALGLGQGAGIGGINLLGGDVYQMKGVTFGGPGLPEPQAPWKILNEWPMGNNKRGYYIVNVNTGARKFAMIDLVTKMPTAVWAAPKPHLAVIGKNMPKHRMVVRLRKNLGKHRADADTILRLTSPQYAGYKSRRRRR